MRLQGNSGNMAEVDSAKRLWTESTSLSQAGFYCRTGDTYSVTTLDAGVLTTPATDGYMLFMKNTGSLSDFAITRIWVATNSANTTVDVHLNMTGTPAANNTALQVFSLRAGDSGTPDMLADVWDGVASGMTGLTVGTTVFTFSYAAGTHVLDVDGGIIVRPGANVAISATDGAGTAKLSCGVEFVEVQR